MTIDTEPVGPAESDDAATATEALDAPSAPFVGRWSHLVSRTNWEKGRIILEWREALQRQGLPATACSDEAWARKVGGVTPQHVGRLRRVYQRFGETHEQYPGLYWSHFQAALEWDDAEMWLEGAVQERWSVAAMRRQRAETLGRPPEEAPAVGEVVEVDQSYMRVLDAVPILPEDHPPATPSSSATPSRSPSPRADGKKAVDEEPVPFDVQAGSGDDEGQVPAVRPFESLSEELPEDLQEALEMFKLAILRHKQAGWREASPDDVVAALEGLRRLVEAG